MSIRNQAIKGGVWSLFGNSSIQVLSFIFNIIMARLLMPDEFGIYGMMLVIVGIIVLFQEMGLGPALIYDQKISKIQISSIFWINLIFSIVLFLICLSSRNLVSEFFEEESISIYFPYLAAKFPIAALSLVPRNILKKELRLKELNIIRFFAYLTSSLTGVLLALKGFGVWSLVTIEVLKHIITTIMLWGTFRWVPKLVIDIKSVKEHLGFGVNLQAGNFLSYWIRNADNLIIGKFLGATSLGYYQVAYKLMIWPIRKVSGVLTEVMFPTLSKVKDDKERVKKGFLEASRHISWVVFPLVGFVFIQADNIIIVILGDNWKPSIPVFQILCVLGINQSILTNINWIFLSQGKTAMRLKLYAILLPIYVISFFVGLNWGIKGVALGYTIMSIFNTPFILNYVGKLVGMTFLDVFRELRFNLIIVIITSAVLLVIDLYYLNSKLIPLIELISFFFVYIILYLIIMILTKNKSYVFMQKEIIQKLISK